MLLRLRGPTPNFAPERDFGFVVSALASYLWETARRRNRLDYISQRCVYSAVLIVNKSHRDTCISWFVLVSGTKGRRRRKGVF